MTYSFEVQYIFVKSLHQLKKLAKITHGLYV